TIAATEDSLVDCARAEATKFLLLILTPSMFREFLPHPVNHRLRYQARDRTAEAENLFYQTRTEVRVLLSRHQKDSLHLRIQPSIHERHLQFILVIGNRADSPDNCLRSAAQSVVDEQ